MTDKARFASVQLPDSLIKEIAKQLNIKDITRIPRNLVVNAADLKAISASAARGVALPGGLAVIDVVP